MLLFLANYLKLNTVIKTHRIKFPGNTACGLQTIHQVTKKWKQWAHLTRHLTLTILICYHLFMNGIMINSILSHFQCTLISNLFSHIGTNSFSLFLLKYLKTFFDQAPMHLKMINLFLIWLRVFSQEKLWPLKHLLCSDLE